MTAKKRGLAKDKFIEERSETVQEGERCVLSTDQALETLASDIMSLILSDLTK